jgi:hypothetical protein
MTFILRSRALIETDVALWILVLFAFSVRIAGIGYGLPLTVVADEPPFTLAALQMIQLHTVIPAFHVDAFKSILYYPPYLSYLYLIPFTAVTAVLYLLWHGGSALFSAHLISDLSVFFLIARVVSVALGACSVFLIYRIAQSLFHSRIAAAIAGFLLATSLIHESLSMVGRHWIPISFIFLVVLYVLTRERLPENRKIFYTFLIAGVGMGVSTFSGVALVLVGLWFFLVSETRLRDAFRDSWILSGGIMFLLLAPLPTLLYPYSQGFFGGVLLLHGQTTLLGFIASPVSALLKYAYAEPVLILLFLAGIGAFWNYHRRWCICLLAFFLFYVLLFYSVAAFESRFLVPLVPFYALFGGYAGYLMSRTRVAALILLVLLLVPLVSAVRLSTLAYQSDTRTFARNWALSELQPTDKVLVYGELLRLPANSSSLAELRSIDPAAVRKTDEAEATLDRTDVPYALNLYTVQNETFLENLATYAHDHNYDYLIYEPAYTSDTRVAAQFDELIRRAQLVRTWEGFGNSFSVAGSGFTASLPQLFANKSLGPTMFVYKLR